MSGKENPLCSPSEAIPEVVDRTSFGGEMESAYRAFLLSGSRMVDLLLESIRTDFVLTLEPGAVVA